jgi:hypothetical protein
MSESKADNLGMSWLDELVEQSQSEPVFEGAKWNSVLAELGRITVHFEMLSFNLQWLLVTLEEPKNLAADTGRHAHKPMSELIRKCGKALKKLDASLAGRDSMLIKLFNDCNRQLVRCDELNKRRNELIHALWSAQAFRPHSVTRLRVPRPKKGERAEIKAHEHDSAELRAAALEIRNTVYPLHALTMKLRVALQRPQAFESQESG